MSKRVFLIVLDSCGVGMLPDASEFGDYDCNTLKRISASPEFSAENMLKMGIGNIAGCDYLVQRDIGKLRALFQKSLCRLIPTASRKILSMSFP